MSDSAARYCRARDFEPAANPRLLRGMLAEAEEISRRLERLPEEVTPIDLLEDVPRGCSSESERERLLQRRHELLDRIIVEAIPFGKWIRCGGELVYVEKWLNLGDEEDTLYLYRLPARAARWIAATTNEEPQISVRRADYARYRQLVMAIGWMCMLSVPLAVAGALVAGSWTVTLLLGAVACACWLASGVYMLCDEYLWQVVDEYGPHEPFELIASGTGEASQVVLDRRRRAAQRCYKRRLRRLAPWPAEPLEKTHDYDYEYGGLAGEEARCRVRIFQGVRRRSAPVIAISQALAEGERPGASSITALIEAVSAEVVLSELPHLLPGNRFSELWALIKPPFRVIEHYSEGYTSRDRGPGDFEGEATWVVTFHEYALRRPTGALDFVDNPINGRETTITRSAKNARPCLGEPEWHRLGRNGAGRLTGGQF